jgi:cell division protein FtsL
MHIDQATPKKMSRKEKIILTIESIAIVMLFIFFIFLFLISDIIENYFLGL